MMALVSSSPVHDDERESATPLLLLRGRPVDHRAMMADSEPRVAAPSGLPGMGHTPGADWIRQEDRMLDVGDWVA